MPPRQIVPNVEYVPVCVPKLNVAVTVADCPTARKTALDVIDMSLPSGVMTSNTTKAKPVRLSPRCSLRTLERTTELTPVPS